MKDGKMKRAGNERNIAFPAHATKETKMKREICLDNGDVVEVRLENCDCENKGRVSVSVLAAEVYTEEEQQEHSEWSYDFYLDICPYCHGVCGFWG
jgi:hypothetical protein